MDIWVTSCQVCNHPDLFEPRVIVTPFQMDCLPGKQLVVKAPALVLTACQPKLLFGGPGGDDDHDDDEEDDEKEAFNDDNSSAFFGGSLTVRSASNSSSSTSSTSSASSASSSSSSAIGSSSSGGGGGAMWVTRGQRHGRRRARNGFPPGPCWSQALWGGAGDGSYRSSGGGSGGGGASGATGGGGSSLLFPFGGMTGAGLGCPSFGSLDQLDPVDATAMVRLAVDPATVLASLGAAAAAAAAAASSTSTVSILGTSTTTATAVESGSNEASPATKQQSNEMLAAIEVEDMSLPLQQLETKQRFSAAASPEAASPSAMMQVDGDPRSNSDISFAAALADALLPLKRQLAQEAINRRKLCAAVQVFFHCLKQICTESCAGYNTSTSFVTV